MLPTPPTGCSPRAEPPQGRPHGCDINLSDGTTQRILGGGVRGAQRPFRRPRVIEFEAPAGAPPRARTGCRPLHAGQMQVVDASGAMSSVASAAGAGLGTG
ncbi:MAG: hypothetical protein IPF42_07215 [Candidatus Microthrix sp.]|nr:hypothetical protein [Candidatus Microthrix sp.]